MIPSQKHAKELQKTLKKHLKNFNFLFEKSAKAVKYQHSDFIQIS
jgi:hypothetical protein